MQWVVRQRTERGIRVAEGEVGGSKVINRLRTALLGKRHRNHGIDGLNRQKDSPRLPHDCLQCPGGLREYKHCAQVESLVILTVKILIKLSLSGLSRYVIRHFRYGKETGRSLLSQRLLGLLLGTGKKNWPIADRRFPSNDPRNRCETNSAPVSLSFLKSQMKGT